MQQTKQETLNRTLDCEPVVQTRRGRCRALYTQSKGTKWFEGGFRDRGNAGRTGNFDCGGRGSSMAKWAITSVTAPHPAGRFCLTSTDGCGTQEERRGEEGEGTEQRDRPRLGFSVVAKKSSGNSCVAIVNALPYLVTHCLDTHSSSDSVFCNLQQRGVVFDARMMVIPLSQRISLIGWDSVPCLSPLGLSMEDYYRVPTASPASLSERFDAAAAESRGESHYTSISPSSKSEMSMTRVSCSLRPLEGHALRPSFASAAPEPYPCAGLTGV